MKISICIPQYNRIQYLLRSLRIIENQTYDNIEIVISDDYSVDDTESEIKKIIPSFKYPIIYNKNEINKGYDYNYRKSIELASGDYCLVIGNDDSLVKPDNIATLAKFLHENQFPDIGFCNMLEERTGNTLVERAYTTAVLGSGAEIALKYYSCFSFVGGLIYKKSSFDKFNTSKFDESIYSQMYLGVMMVTSGCILFSIKEPLVLKDMLLEGKFRNSYRDRIAKKWKDYRIVDGGLPSVINVLINGLKDANELTQKRTFFIFKRMYSITYPHWILDYKSNKALPEAVGLIIGLNPAKNKNLHLLTALNRIRIFLLYYVMSLAGLLTPVFLFNSAKSKLYKLVKR
jgi:glycosyltransferase involved in cell wall biosynthesis